MHGTETRHILAVAPFTAGEILKIGEADEDRFDRSRRISWLDLDSIFKAKVLLVGAGALGNEVAKDLALSGFREITVVDMDHVSGSNLNRCLFFSELDAKLKSPKAQVVAEGMKRLSPHANPRHSNGRIQDLPDSIYTEQDVVLGCLDNIDARIHVNSHSYVAGKIYIDGGMEGLLGKVVVSRPPDGACVQCGMNRSHAKVAGLRFSCTGKDSVFYEPRVAAEITTTSIIAAVMVREAIKVVSRRQDMLLSNAFFYDGQRNVAEEMEIELDPSCPVHLGGR